MAGSEIDTLGVDLANAREELADLQEAADNLVASASTCQAHVDAKQQELEQARQRLTGVQRQLQDAKMKRDQAAVLVQRLKDQFDLAEARAAAEAEKANATATVVEPATGELSEEDRIREVAERFGMFTVADLAAATKITVKTVNVRIKHLVELGEMQPTGTKFRGKVMYEHLGAKQAEKELISEGVRLVRDWVVKQKKEFAPKEITDATEVVGEELDNALMELLRMGTVEYVGFDDLMLYQYVPPTSAGEAAERDAARSKAKAAEQDQVERTGPVGGTGKKNKLKLLPEVRDLVERIEAAGGKVEHAANGHLAVTAPGSNRRVLISHTPGSRSRSLLNDKARLRRELQLNIR